MSRDISRGFLTEPRYIDFISETHPELALSRDRFELPSFVANLDVREPLKPGALRNFASWVAPMAGAAMLPPAVFLGTPFERYDQSHILDEVPDPDDLAQRAKDWARKHDRELVVITNVDADSPSLDVWAAADFTVLPSFPDTLVDLDVATFDNHLARLAPADRSSVRRNSKRFDRAGHRLVRIDDAQPVGDALFRAYKPMFDRATVKWLPHSRAYFARLSELGEQVHLTAALSSDDEVLGFVVAFEDGTTVQSGRIGITPEWYRQDAIYFRLMYHLLQDALRLPAQHISLEPTAYRMKRHLGARPKPMVNLVMGVSARWRALLSTMAPVGRQLLRHLENEEELENSY